MTALVYSQEVCSRTNVLSLQTFCNLPRIRDIFRTRQIYGALRSANQRFTMHRQRARLLVMHSVVHIEEWRVHRSFLSPMRCVDYNVDGLPRRTTM